MPGKMLSGGGNNAKANEWNFCGWKRLKRVQHRLCPSRFPPPYFASSRPTKRFHPDPACLYLSTCNWCKPVTGRLVLKWIENTFYCFRTKGNIPEIRTWNPQSTVEGQNRTTTWKTSARGFSSLGLFVWSKWYIMLRNHLCSLCYWNSIFYLKGWYDRVKTLVLKSPKEDGIPCCLRK